MESLIQYGDYCLKILFHQEYSKTSLLGFFFSTKNKQSRNFKFLTQGKVAFNLEMSQNGSYLYMYVPHGILNWVWVKWNYHMILKFCATDFTKLTSPALPSFPAHLYAFQFHELSFCCPFIMKQKQKNNKSTNEAWIDQQSNVCRKSKCTLQSLPELCGTPNPKNYSYTQSLKWQSFRAYKLTYFSKFTFIIAC